MSSWRNMELGKAIQFNPPERISKGVIAKKIAMEKLTPFEKKIRGFEMAEYSAGPKFRNGDTLVAKITPCLENGKTAQVDILDNGEVAFGSSEFIVLRNNGNSILDYIFYVAKSPAFRKKAISCMEGTSGRKRVNEGALKLQVLPIPDTKTQQKIASVLSSLDSKIELNNRINRELEQMAKLLYDYWFVQFEFPDKAGKPYKTSGGKMVWNEKLKREIPEGWEVVPISNVLEVKDGTHDSPKPTHSGYKLITSKNLKIEGLDFESANFISEEDYISIIKRSKVDTGDILYSMIGNIGTVYKVEEANINFAIKNVALFKTSEKKEYKNFAYLYLKSIDMSRYLKNEISGSIQKFIGLGSLRNIPFLLNENIIRQYTKRTNPIFSMLENLKLENQQLASLRDWLLPMLMNGQVTVGAKEKVNYEVTERVDVAAEPGEKTNHD